MKDAKIDWGREIGFIKSVPICFVSVLICVLP